MKQKPKIVTAFLRYNIIAVLATFVDFLVFIILTQFFDIWYVSSTFIGAICGGITAFVLNRNWAFMSKKARISNQAIRYLIVWGVSIILNTSGLYIMVENTTVDEIISKVIVSVIVSIGYNFLMNKYFVFK